MNEVAYKKFRDDQLDKIGNTAIYLSQKIERLSKTKLLKLLYILDEISIVKSGIPFLNLSYKVWKFGPVSDEIFVDLSSEIKLLANYIKREDGYIKAVREFNDDEFSDNDIELMEHVISRFGKAHSRELIKYTHRANAPWHNAATKNNVLELLQKEIRNTTDIIINMGELVAEDEQKRVIYEDYIEAF